MLYSSPQLLQVLFLHTPKSLSQGLFSECLWGPAGATRRGCERGNTTRDHRTGLRGPCHSHRDSSRNKWEHLEGAHRRVCFGGRPLWAWQTRWNLLAKVTVRQVASNCCIVLEQIHQQTRRRNISVRCLGERASPSEEVPWGEHLTNPTFLVTIQYFNYAF